MLCYYLVTHTHRGRTIWGGRLSLSAIKHRRQEREICQVRDWDSIKSVYARHTFDFLILQNEESMTWTHSGLLRPRWDKRGEECVASGKKSVPSVWEQAAISLQACETFLGRLSRLDSGMEGRGGRRLGAVGSLCLVPPNPHHKNTNSALTAASLSLCQQGRPHASQAGGVWQR